MGNEIVQATYPTLTEIAQQFTAHAEMTQQTYDRVVQGVDQLRNGNWIGAGSDAFFSEMDAEALPAIQRMILALQTGSQVTVELSEIVRQAEEEAAARYGNDSMGSIGGSGGGAGGGGAAIGVASAAIAGTAGGGGASGGGTGGTPRDQVNKALQASEPSAISKIIAAASPKDKAAMVADRKLMEQLRKQLTPAQLRAVGQELVNNNPFIPNGPLKEQLGTLAVSQREVDANTAKHMINGTMRSYHVEDLKQPANVDKMVTDAGFDPDTYTIFLTPDTNEPMLVQKEGVLGFTFGGSTNIYVSKEAAPDDIRATLVHEVNHARNAPVTTTESRYQSEFRAYWVEGGHFDKIADPNKRAIAIKEHVLAGYDIISNDYYSNPAVKKAIDSYTRPTGNLTNK